MITKIRWHALPRCCVLIGAMTLCGSARVDAQGPVGLVILPGTEIRLIPRAADAPRLRGRVIVLARDTIVLRVGGASSAIPLADLAALEVRGGENKRRGFLIGAGIATVITGTFGGIDLGKGNITRDDFVGSLLFNALIGGLVGYAFAPKGWERIPLPGAP